MSNDSTIQGGASVHAAQVVHADTGDDVNMTAEALLVYCQTRLGDLDHDIRTLMDRQRDAIQAKQVLSELRTELNEARQAGERGESLGGFVTGIKAGIDAYDRAIAKLPEGHPLAAALEAEKRELFFEPNADPSVPAQSSEEEMAGASVAEEDPERAYDGMRYDVAGDDWDGILERVDTRIEGVNDDSEIHMIQLQSLMSTRQTAISLTTNMMNKLQGTDDTIVGNIR